MLSISYCQQNTVPFQMSVAFLDDFWTKYPPTDNLRICFLGTVKNIA